MNRDSSIDRYIQKTSRWELRYGLEYSWDERRKFWALWEIKSFVRNQLYNEFEIWGNTIWSRWLLAVAVWLRKKVKYNAIGNYIAKLGK